MITFWRSLRVTVVFAILLGLVYPLAVTGIGNVLFPYQAQGSIIQWHGQPVGSELITQPITDPGLFHPRPSTVNYAANASGGSNLGPANPALITEVKKNLQLVEQQNPGTPVTSIPTSMVESSASGLDPDITVEDALLQVPRIARATGLSQSYLRGLVNQYEQRPIFGIWGEPVVNVMQINMALLRHTGH